MGIDTLCNPIGFQIQIFPTKEQEKIIKKYFGVSRYIYNWSIDQEKNRYNIDGSFIYKNDLCKLFTRYKKENIWLNKFDSTSLKIIIRDVVDAFIRFFNGLSFFPKYKTKKEYRQSMAVRSDRLKVYNNKVYIPSIGWISSRSSYTDKIYGSGNQYSKTERYVPYYNARIRYYRSKYILSFTTNIDRDCEVEYNSIIKYKRNLIPKSPVIGIDVGCKTNNWIVDSNGVRVSLPDNTKEDYKISRLRKVLSRKILHQRTNGEQYKETNNIRKIKQRINKYYARKSNKRDAKMYDYIIHNIVEEKPLAVVIENISVNDFYIRKGQTNLPEYNRRSFNKKIQYASLYSFQNVLQYKLSLHNILLITAESGYKSTQMCSTCGFEQHMGSKKVYRCPNCGLEIDRDLNAAYNLKNYPYINGILY